MNKDGVKLRDEQTTYIADCENGLAYIKVDH